MAKSNSTRRAPGVSYEQRAKRRQRTVFIIISVIVILAWVVGLLVNI